MKTSAEDRPCDQGPKRIIVWEVAFKKRDLMRFWIFVISSVPAVSARQSAVAVLYPTQKVGTDTRGGIRSSRFARG